MGLGKVVGSVVQKALDKNKIEPIVEQTMVDNTAWMVDSSYAQILVPSTNEIKYMCMLAYAFMAGKAFLDYYLQVPYLVYLNLA